MEAYLDISYIVGKLVRRGIHPTIRKFNLTCCALAEFLEKSQISHRALQGDVTEIKNPLPILKSFPILVLHAVSQNFQEKMFKKLIIKIVLFTGGCLEWVLKEFL